MGRPPGVGPGQGPGGGGEPADPNARRKEQLETIKEIFRKALAYDEVVREARRRGQMPPSPDPGSRRPGPLRQAARSR